MRKFKWVWLFLSLVMVFLGGARCGSSGTSVSGTNITQAVVATGIKYTNEPENQPESIPASSREIYLSVQVANPTKSTEVRVGWYQLPNQTVATESFTGKRDNSGNQLDFEYRKTSSWLASRVERPGLSWPVGEYRTEVYLNNQLVKTVFFNVVSDSEAEKINAQKAIQAVSFSDTIDDNNALVAAKTLFTRTTATIYIQVQLDAQSGAELDVGVRHVKSGLLINTFSTVTTGDKTLLFTLSRDQFGRFWSDKLWPLGSFEVTVKLNGVLAKTSIFLIQA